MDEVASLILGHIDGVILTTGETLFNSTVIQITNLTYILLTIMIVMLGINMSLNVFRISMRDSMQIIMRVVLVLIVGLSWSNFDVIFNAATNSSQALALSFFAPFSGGTDAATATAALDNFGDQMAATTDEVAEATSSYFRSLVAFFIYCILALLIAAYVIIVGASKIVLAFLIGIAPFAVMCTIFDKTKTIFEGWLTTTVANLLYPIVAAGVVGTIVSVARTIFSGGGDGATLGDFMSFIVLMLAGVMAIQKIPSVAHGLTGSFGVAGFSPKPLTVMAGALGAAAGATYAGRKLSNRADAAKDALRSGARRADGEDYNGLSRDQSKESARQETMRAHGQKMMREKFQQQRLRVEFRNPST